MPSLKRGSKGFTLMELMVVMAIMAVLAAIVAPAVSGTKEVSTEAQVKSDAGLVQSAIGEFFGDQEGAELLSPATTTILGATVTEETSSKWPEVYLTVAYLTEFPPDAATDDARVTPGEVIKVELVDKDGYPIESSADANDDEVFLAANHTAIDFVTLVNGGYIPDGPGSVYSMDTFYNFLWLLEKTEAAGEAGEMVESRTVVVFKLAKVQETESSGDVTLTYTQIF